ncbi:HlyD family secretion protein [Variovorax sp. HW608]|uniref:HlyD family secretion protein n=1 Tax=Variovorax sp. HW608 TaxID=1034889 RepID=UPI00081F879B|nr:efflux RND transporter periplasmic adaptor subunit [Variovorax sp. HW608]SCK20749.1 HlyD family secretion protein [Variovorax sp. HW608]
MRTLLGSKRLVYAAAGAALLAVVAGAYLVLRPAAPSDAIEANGQIRGTEVTLSARIPGIAEIVAVREGEFVAKGQLVAQIAARELEARLTQARARSAGAQGLIAELDAQLRVLDETSEQARLGAQLAQGTTSHEVHRADEAMARSAADIAAAEAQANQDQVSYERFEKLLEQGFVSRNYLDEMATRLRASQARLTAVRRAAEEARAARDKARAASGEVEIRERDVLRLAAERQRVVAARATAESQAQAALAAIAEVEAQLADTRLFAPGPGTVMARLAEPGELVAAGRPIATLVDLGDLFVRVYVTERDVGRIRLGDAASVAVDAFPGRVFAGAVSEIAQQAEFTPKEVHMKDEREKLVFAVKVRLAEPQGLLKPGMPADVKIKVSAGARS